MMMSAGPKPSFGAQPRPTALLLGALAGTFALGAQAAPATDVQEENAPAVHVRIDDLNLNTTLGTQALYRRIVAAAQSVCQQEDIRELERLRLSRACTQQAIDRAVQEVNSPRLAALHETRVKG